MKSFSAIEGPNLDWTQRGEWGIDEDAWETLRKADIPPALVFAHPKVLTLVPCFLKYYRSVSLVSQKGLAAMAGVSNIQKIESGKVGANSVRTGAILALSRSVNEVTSAVVALSRRLNRKKVEGMMHASAGTSIDESWRNRIGEEGERVIRTIILNGLLEHDEVTSLIDKADNTRAIQSTEAKALAQDVRLAKAINLKNGCSVSFSSEPDVTMRDAQGKVLGVIEIKAGLDPAGALERLGAMFKSFENTLAEFPDAATIFIASCITPEVDNRLNAAMVVRQKYMTTTITSNAAEKRKFVNRLRMIMGLASKSL